MKKRLPKDFEAQPRKKVTIDDVLSATSYGKDIFQRYLGTSVPTKKNILNPFNPNDTKPGLSVYWSKTGRRKMLYKDYGDPDRYGGDAIDFAAHYFGLDPKTEVSETLRRLSDDFNISHNVNGYHASIVSVKPPEYESGNTGLDYWLNVIGPEKLKPLYDEELFLPIEWFKHNGIKTTASKESPIFGFRLGEAIKIYQPFKDRNNSKHLWLGSKPINCNVFGLDHLPNHCERLLIVEGPNDWIVAKGNGYHAIGLDQAGTNLTKQQVTKINSIAEEVILFLDNDEAGIKAAKKLSNLHGWPYAVLPGEWGKDIKDFYTKAKQKGIDGNELLEGWVAKASLGLLGTLEYNHSLKLEKPVPIISVAGNTIATQNNITVLSGASKSGKSGILGAIVGGTMVAKGNPTDTCGIDVARNKEGKAVLHFDTEQSKYDYYSLVRKTLTRASRESKPPDWFKSYHFLELGLENRVEEFKRGVRISAKKHNGVHLIVVDGIADFLNGSVLDEEKCNALVEEFYAVAREYECPLLTVLHLNPGKDSEKTRGHLGSQLERRCESQLKISKKGGMSVLEPTLLRNGGYFDGIKFEYNTDKGYHVYAGNYQMSIKEQKARDRFKEAKELFRGEPGGMFAKELQESIEQMQGVKDRTAKARIKEMKEVGAIEKRDDNKYYLVQKSEKRENNEDGFPF